MIIVIANNFLEVIVIVIDNKKLLLGWQSGHQGDVKYEKRKDLLRICGDSQRLAETCRDSQRLA